MFVSYRYSVDLPFCFELYRKSLQLVLKTRVTLRANGVVYFYSFLFNYHTMRDAGNARQRKKTIAEIRLHPNELEKFWQGLGGFPSGSWICLKHRNEMNRNDKRCPYLSSWGLSRKLAKIPIPTHLYQAFDQLGKSFSGYKPGKNWCTKCKVETDKKFKEQRKYIPRKRKTCNKRKVE